MEDPTTWQFGFTQVIEIIVLTASAVGTYYALKRSGEKNAEKIKTQEEKIRALEKATEEKFLHAKNSKKANIQMLMDTIKLNREEVEKKEKEIYEEIAVVRSESKDAHHQFNAKLDIMSNKMDTINIVLAELTGYFRAKKESK